MEQLLRNIRTESIVQFCEKSSCPTLEITDIASAHNLTPKVAEEIVIHAILSYKLNGKYDQPAGVLKLASALPAPPQTDPLKKAIKTSTIANDKISSKLFNILSQ